MSILILVCSINLHLFKGSVQGISDIPDDLKLVFRTAFELDQRHLIDMAADRGPFIDQSQSLSLFVVALTSTDMVSSFAS